MSFSIIVPVYNVELFVEECIRSVISQSYKDFELILVNDGSLDSSGEICDHYATKDSRLNVIHQENGGLSDARNRGLASASNENIIFLDSDDLLAEDILNKLNDMIEKHTDFDLITCTHNTLNNENVVKKVPMEMRPINEMMTKEELYKEMSQASSVYWSASTNVFKRSKIEDEKLQFRKDLIGAEDCDFYMNYVRLSEKIVISDYSLINYRVSREGSITDKMSKEAVMGQLKVFSENYYFYEFKNNSLKRYFANKFANTVFLLSKLQNVEEVKDCVEFIVKNKEILNSTYGSKYNFSKLLWKFRGYYNGSILLSKVKTIIG